MQLCGLGARHLLHDACLDVLFPMIKPEDASVALMIMEDVWGAAEGEDDLQVGVHALPPGAFNEVTCGFSPRQIDNAMRRAQGGNGKAVSRPAELRQRLLALAQAIVHRRAAMVVGPCGCGKSLLISMAAELISIAQTPITAKVSLSQRLASRLALRLVPVPSVVPFSLSSSVKVPPQR